MVKDTGERLTEIVKSSNQIVSLISDISVASEEQKNSIIGINKSVSSLDIMTQQNAALVEETAGASDEMAERTKDLVKLIGRFKINALS